MSGKLRPSSKAYQVVIPQLGLTMQEAAITEWFYQDGDWVEKGEPLFMLENEKSMVEIESPASGRLVIQTQAGDTVPVLHPIALIEGEGQAVDFSASSEKDQLQEEERKQVRTSHTVPVTRKQGSRVPTSPRARVEARQKGIDLIRVSGSGIRGMITLKDLEGHQPLEDQKILASPVALNMAKAEQIDLQTVQGSGPRGMIMRHDVEKSIQSKFEGQEKDILSSLDGLRGIIARRLSQSWQERPHVTLTTEVDVSQLVVLRKQINKTKVNDGDGPRLKVSYNALLIKLTAESLQQHPNMNVSLTDAGIEVHPQINIGFAVDTERGLMVPVIHDVLNKSTFIIQEDLEMLAERAREGRSLPDELTGGTFTITNLGAYGIDAFTPIINPPESAVLGVGRILARPVGENGEIVLRETVVLSLTFDHRLIDGAPAASFMYTLAELLEKPPKPAKLVDQG